MKRNKLAICILGCLKLFVVSIAVEGVELTKPEGDFYSAQDSIKIRLGTLPKAIWPYLHLEMDDIDVTQFTSQFNDLLKYQPAESLATGPHQLRLIAMTPDGNIEEIAYWQLNIRTSSGFIESNIESNMDLQITQRIADDFDSESDSINRTQGQGSATFATTHSTNDVRITSYADFMYNSQRDQTLNNRQFDMNQFNLTSEWSQAGVSIGHQNAPASSLVLADFNRRGVSASANTESRNVVATVFGMRTETITGFENGLGVSDSHHRTDGAVIQLVPLTSEPEKLIVTATHLDGRGQVDGVAELADDTPDTGGDASALAVESYNLKKQLYLRGEYARSSYDFDGIDNGFDAEDDDAYSLYVQYATDRDQSRTEASNWTVGLLHQQVGPWFHSLANTYLPSDKELTQLNSAYFSPRWQISANAAYEQSNVTDDQSVPTLETRIVSTQLNYTPQSGDSTSSSGLFANPSYALAVTQSEQEQVTTPAGFVGDRTDRNNSEVSLVAGFSGDAWNWQLTHSLSNEEDKTNINSDLKNTITSLDASFPITTQFSLTPVIQATRSRDIDAGITIDGWNTGLTINYANQDDWSGGLSYTVSRENGNDGFTNSRTAIIEFLAMWQYQQALENKPGVRLFTTANYQDTDSLDLSTDQYQVFVGLNINWPVSF